MLSKNELEEIRAHLDRAQNPLFFFDNDNDGLVSFLLLRRFIGRGNGVSIRSFPDLNSSYFSKVLELKPDYIFVLDKPKISKDFIEKVNTENIPIVCIDHHQVEKIENVDYYNPFYSDGKNEPVSYLAYKIVNNKRDVWLATIGCISDCFMPDFIGDFLKEYPDLGRKTNEPFELLYNSEIGRVARVLDFSLKDCVSNVSRMIKFLIEVNSPWDILEETLLTKKLFKRFEELESKYSAILERARKEVKQGIIYFKYGGELSLSSNIANRLSYEFPNKLIVIVYVRDMANISLRGPGDVLEITLKSIEGIEGATGGGHLHATGAKVPLEDLPRFKENLERAIS